MKLPKELENVPCIPGFRAVEESRKWKEEIARETEGMNQEQLIAYFNQVSIIQTDQPRQLIEVN